MRVLSLLLVIACCASAASASWTGSASTTTDSASPTSADCFGFVGYKVTLDEEESSDEATIEAEYEASSQGNSAGWAAPTGGGDQKLNTQEVNWTSSSEEDDQKRVRCAVGRKLWGYGSGTAQNGATIYAIWRVSLDKTTFDVDGTVTTYNFWNTHALSDWIQAANGTDQTVNVSQPSNFTSAASADVDIPGGGYFNCESEITCSTSWSGTNQGPGPGAPYFVFAGDFGIIVKTQSYCD